MTHLCRFSFQKTSVNFEKIIFKTYSHILYCDLGPSWSWSYGNWIYNYLCNQYLSSLQL